MKLKCFLDVLEIRTTNNRTNNTFLYMEIRLITRKQQITFVVNQGLKSQMETWDRAPKVGICSADFMAHGSSCIEM
jgi:hypothetical protein